MQAGVHNQWLSIPVVPNRQPQAGNQGSCPLALREALKGPVRLNHLSVHETLSRVTLLTLVTLIDPFKGALKETPFQMSRPPVS